jgi:hypothetical protein
MTRMGLGFSPLSKLGFPSLITNSLIVFLNTSYVFHVLVVFNTPSDWFNYQSLARLLPVPACIIILFLLSHVTFCH